MVKRYGLHNEQKQKPENCIEIVWSGNWHNHQCRRKKVIGDYCKQHSQPKVKEN